jgi:Phage integrase family
MNPGMSLKSKFKPALKSLALPNIGYHDFRHNLITWLGHAKYSPKMIEEIVGHSDINTTLSVYTHPSVEEKKNALASVSMRLLSGPDPANATPPPGIIQSIRRARNDPDTAAIAVGTKHSHILSAISTWWNAWFCG